MGYGSYHEKLFLLTGPKWKYLNKNHYKLQTIYNIIPMKLLKTWGLITNKSTIRKVYTCASIQICLFNDKSFMQFNCICHHRYCILCERIMNIQASMICIDSGINGWCFRLTSLWQFFPLYFSTSVFFFVSLFHLAIDSYIVSGGLCF